MGGTGWESMLRESLSKSRLPDSAVVLVGPKGCGKSGLVSAFNPREDSSKDGTVAFHPVLAYDFFDAADPAESSTDRDDCPARVSVWSCSDLDCAHLLRTVLTSEELENSSVVLCFDMSRPWEALKQLESWYKFLQEHLFEGGNHSAGGAGNSGSLLGVPTIVVGCKADEAQADTFEQQQKFLFLQQQLRRFCLKCGAALVYTSARKGSNCQLIQRYILHSIYPSYFSFEDGAKVDDDVFIPAGWDSLDLITSLLSKERLKWDGEDSLEKILAPPEEEGAGAIGADSAEATVPEEDWLRELSKTFSSTNPVNTQSNSTDFSEDVVESDATAGSSEGTSDSTQLRSFFEGLLQSGGTSSPR